MNHRGFATPLALGFAMLMALVAAAALHDAGLARSLSTARLLHQRAFSAGEFGLAQAVIDLNPPHAVIPASRRILLPGHPTDSVEVTTSETLATALPNGYSAGRVIERHFEVRSIGQSVRNARVVQVEGLSRLAVAGSRP